MRLTFLGAAGTVTGSRYLLEAGGKRLLIDCGLFQGLKQLRLRNWDRFPVEPASIDAVVLTHAHIDHSGYLPALARAGFKGPVYATPATCDLAALLLPDAGHLQEEEADFANRHGFSRHHPALALFTEEDARRSLHLLRARPMGQPFEPWPGLQACFIPAGHILGAASVHLTWEGRSLLVSGDLGRDDDLLIVPPATPPAADVVLLESTYGNRLHAAEDPATALAEVVNRTAARGGVVVVPAFAVGRAQALLHLLATLKAQHRIPDLPVYLDSPMATDVTGLFLKHHDAHRLSEAQTRAMCRGATVVNGPEQSQQLDQQRMPSVIVSASGMATGGRVVHHIKALAPDARNTILLAGYQAAGTRGATLAAGGRELKIHGAYVKVRAEVVNLGALSAHADRDGLVAWLGRLPAPPREVWLVHGEPDAADRLRLAIDERLHWPVRVAEPLQQVAL